MIKVYCKAGCPQCDFAKVALKRHGYKYAEVRIDEDDTARSFLIESGHRSVPKIYVNDNLLVEGGFAGLDKMTTKQIALRIREINGN